MKTATSKEGLQYLRLAWAALAIAVVSAAFLAWTGYWYLGAEERKDLVLKRQLSEVQGRVGMARRERDDLQASSLMFQSLLAQGILEDESRLRLIERLDRLKLRYRLVGLEYDIAPQRTLPAPGGRAFEAIEVVSSRVGIKAFALHEGDLIAFLDDLAKPPRGFNPIQNCSLRRVMAAAAQDNSRVEATCALEWVSIKDKRGSRAG